MLSTARPPVKNISVCSIQVAVADPTVGDKFCRRLIVTFNFRDDLFLFGGGWVLKIGVAVQYT